MRPYVFQGWSSNRTGFWGWTSNRELLEGWLSGRALADADKKLLAMLDTNTIVYTKTKWLIAWETLIILVNDLGAEWLMIITWDILIILVNDLGAAILVIAYCYKKEFLYKDFKKLMLCAYTLVQHAQRVRGNLAPWYLYHALTFCSLLLCWLLYSIACDVVLRKSPDPQIMWTVPWDN